MLPDFIKTGFDLSSRNTLALPGEAAFFAPIKTLEELIAVSQSQTLSNLRRFILGGGSNLVLTGDFPGLVIAMELKGRSLVRQDEAAWYVRAAAGENWHDFVQWTIAKGWPGLENLSLIPGTVGAAPVQNIGAYGLEVGEMIEGLEAFDLESREIRCFSAADCAFGYRTSLLKQEGWHLNGRYAITHVTFRLPKRWQPRLSYPEVQKALPSCRLETPTPKEIAEAVMEIRRRKLPDPAHLPNAGSFFQNPVINADFAAALTASYPDMPFYPQKNGEVKLSAGWLIEQAGWKGRNLGPVGMYEHQALILVNRSMGKDVPPHGWLARATGHDIKNIARAVREAVLARFGIYLAQEPVSL